MPLTYTFSVVRVGDDGIETAVSVSDWADFDADSSSPTFRTFTFTPHRSWHAGKYKVRVQGEDAGIGGAEDTKKSDFAEFVLEVLDFNDAPVASSLVGTHGPGGRRRGPRERYLSGSQVYGRGGGQSFSQSCVHGFVSREGFGWAGYCRRRREEDFPVSSGMDCV